MPTSETKDRCPKCGADDRRLSGYSAYYACHSYVPAGGLRFVESNDCLRAQLTAALSEVERLNGIVGKLPVTKDGVPVVPGMTVYANRIDDDGSYPRPYIGRVKTPHAEFDGVQWSRLLTECYSTEAAATASINGGGE